MLLKLTAAQIITKRQSVFKLCSILRMNKRPFLDSEVARPYPICISPFPYPFFPFAVLLDAPQTKQTPGIKWAQREVCLSMTCVEQADTQCVVSKNNFFSGNINEKMALYWYFSLDWYHRLNES